MFVAAFDLYTSSENVGAGRGLVFMECQINRNSNIQLNVCNAYLFYVDLSKV